MYKQSSHTYEGDLSNGFGSNTAPFAISDYNRAQADEDERRDLENRLLAQQLGGFDQASISAKFNDYKTGLAAAQLYDDTAAGYKDPLKFAVDPMSGARLWKGNAAPMYDSPTGELGPVKATYDQPITFGISAGPQGPGGIIPTSEYDVAPAPGISEIPDIRTKAINSHFSKANPLDVLTTREAGLNSRSRENLEARTRELEARQEDATIKALMNMVSNGSPNVAKAAQADLDKIMAKRLSVDPEPVEVSVAPVPASPVVKSGIEIGPEWVTITRKDGSVNKYSRAEYDAYKAGKK